MGKVISLHISVNVILLFYEIKLQLFSEEKMEKKLLKDVDTRWISLKGPAKILFNVLDFYHSS